MSSIRPLKRQDRLELQSIWERVFMDSREFTDWYFENRFFPEYGICAEIDGRIASVCHIMPCKINVRGVLLPCGLINGVATLPEYRRKGLMKDCLAALHTSLKSKGVFIISNTPVNADIYRPFSYAPVCEKTVICERGCRKMPCGLSDVTLKDAAEDIFNMYSKLFGKYSGMLFRSRSDMLNRCADWQIDGARVLVHKGSGYAVYHEDGERIVSNEILADSKPAYRCLLDGLLHLSRGKEVHAEFPPSGGIFGNASLKASACIIDPQSVLDALDLPFKFAVKLTDMFNAENNGVFYIGKQSSLPDACMSAAEFTQWIFGYRDFNELNADILNPEACGILREKTERLDCYNTDEY